MHKDTRARLLTIAQDLELLSARSDDNVSELIVSARQKLLDACAELHEQERDYDSEIKDAKLTD